MNSPGHSRPDKAIAWALFGVALAALLWGERSVGFPRDESVYFAAAESYAGWFKQLARDPGTALSDAAIVHAFDFNHEHPALMKNLFGLSYLALHEGLGVRPATAFRFPALLIAAFIPMLLFLFGSAVYGRSAGLFAAASFLLVPRQFFNSELACFDMPVAAMWLLVVYTYWRAQTQSKYWLWCGVAFGLALATKHNALFLPFVLVPFSLWRGWVESKATPEARAQLKALVGLFAAVALLYGLLLLALGPAGFQSSFRLLSPHFALFLLLVAGGGALLSALASSHLGTFRAVAPVVAMAVLGPVIFYAHWPYLWHHPVDRTAWYLAFHAQHNHYTWFYLGELLREPPFPLAYVLVKTALTVPTSLFIPMLLGLGALCARLGLSAWRGTRHWVQPPSFVELLIATNAIASIAIISHPQVPHFGGVKHWFPSMPFLCILAGASVSRAADALREWLSARRTSLGSVWKVHAPLIFLLLLPALIATVRVHPYGTAYYSELAGGLPGAASLGMQRQFWSSHVTGVFEWINQNAPVGARVYLHEVNGFSFRDYQRNGMLRRDLVPAGGPIDAHLAAYQYHQEFREQEFNIWQAFGTVQPVTGLYVDGTPQIVVYRRP